MSKKNKDREKAKNFVVYNPKDVTVSFDGIKLDPISPMVDLPKDMTWAEAQEMNRRYQHTFQFQLEDHHFARSLQEKSLRREAEREAEHMGISPAGVELVANVMGFQVPRIQAMVFRKVRRVHNHENQLETMTTFVVLVILTVQDVNGSGHIAVSLAKEYPAFITAPELRREVRRCILQALTHELDETLYMDGKRFTNPHPELLQYSFHNAPGDDRADALAMAMQALYDQGNNVQTAQGEALDRLAQLCGINRQPEETDVELRARIPQGPTKP